MAQNSTSLWKEYNGKGFAAEYAKYSERSTKDEGGNVISDTYATKSEVSAATASPNDGFYVSRNGRWIKVYDLTVTAIEGFPVDDLDYQKIGQFNGNLYTYAQITVAGSATIGLFNYDTMTYDSETPVTDDTDVVQVSTGGNYEIHAKGGGVVTVIVSADAFSNGGDNG